MVFALLVGAVVLIQADLVLDVRTVYLLIITPFVGAAIYGALFALAGGLQFWLVDGAEFTNAFVYGGAYAGQIPGSTLMLPLRVLFTFVIPATIVAYLPAMLILQLPGPALLPTWLGWLAPLFAVWIWLLSLSGAPASADSPGPEADRQMAEPIIQMTDLRRSFVVRDKAGRVRRTRRVVHAVDGITATIEAGQSCGYIGANGAGKSTTIKMLSGILVPTSGQVRTCGLDPVPNRRVLARDLGVVFGQRSQLWWDLPLRDSFRILAAIHRLDPSAAGRRTDQLVAELGLAGLLSTPVRQLSLGERMRGEVAAALVHSPRLLVLDEPTIGLDMISKERLRQFLIGERQAHGTTLLLTTHDMSDIERLCERVLVVDHGRLVYDGTLADLAVRVALQRVLVVDLWEPTAPLQVTDAEHIGSELNGVRQRLAFSPELTTAARVLAEVSAQVEVRDLTLEEPAIEDIVRTLYHRSG
jgi:ABC-2 type transport system ATP-binding protein